MSQSARPGRDEGTVLNDFAVPLEEEDRVQEHRPRLQALFGVDLDILGVLGRGPQPGETDPPQIWLQLHGQQGDLNKAKNYIKGLCSPEIDLDVSYPKDMHCVFLGAQGLFLHCLVRATCAHISMVALGNLKISGLAVAVVMAHSQIQEFVDRYKKNPQLDEEREVWVKRRFKELVETHNDKHAMDLLILPSAVKEELLSLVRDAHAHPGSATPFHGEGVTWDPTADLTLEGQTGCIVVGPPERLDVPFDLMDVKDPRRLQEASGPPLTGQVLHKRACRPIYDFNHTTCDVLGVHLTVPEPGCPQTRPGEDAKRIQVHRESGGFHDNVSEGHGASTAVAEGNWGLGGLSTGSNGKKEEQEQEMEQGEEDHHCSVLLSSGTEKEFNMMVNFFKTMGYQEEAIRKVLFTDGVQEPSQVLDRLQVEQELKKPRGPPTRELIDYELGEAAAAGGPTSAATTPATATTEDEYVLEVIKSAAKYCGYSPSEITGIPEGAPMADLLIQLNQRKEERSHLGLTLTGSSPALHEDTDPQRALWATPEHSATPMKKSHRAQSQSSPCGLLDSEPWPKAATLPKAGPRMERGDPVLEPLFPQHGWPSPNLPVEDVCPGEAVPESAGAEGVGDPPPQGQDAFPLVTGTQRFTEVMQRPFQLNLKDEPGQDHLRHIIIDGSNVAMIHGLHRFFSCRGIALAVQHFWDRGHRDITVFVPQWRMKKDPKVKEQHFLTQLNELSLLSFTPSRTVAGKRITSYDDRFLLQLAEKTQGVIVTNDNLRDCAEESSKWKEIIKNSVLQFTFVGDIFMVPDDPLGRNGPLLGDFLSKTARTKISKAHSSVNHRTPHHSPRGSAQTEILHLRDRKAVGLPANEQAAKPPRSKRETHSLRQKLLPIFTEPEVDFVLRREPCEKDLNKLSELILNLKT